MPGIETRITLLARFRATASPLLISGVQEFGIDGNHYV